ncbi:MAG: hypothetical protein JO270_08285 [Acidobacteriaceae bacterium]|nr:hypothetical protein [Acidobacteriaceae bacterium]
MASFPTPNVKRVNRRKLGRGQSIQHPAVGVTVTSSASTATLTFSQAVVVNGKPNLVVTGGPTFVSQAVVSPTQITQTYSAALATHNYTLAANDPAIASFQGGGNAAASGTF